MEFAERNIGPVGLGAWGIGGPPFWAERDEATAVATVRKAIDLGVNLIDTAPVYGFGRSEEIIGKAIEGVRDKVLIATKCGLRWKEEKLGGIYNNLKPASIFEELEASLKRLKTDRIDLYQIHWPDPKVSLQEPLVALSLLKMQGKLLNIGVSNFSKEQLEEANQIAEISSVQPKYNLLEREIEDSILPYCQANDIKVLAYSPLASGLLTGKYSDRSQLDGWRSKGNMGIFKKKTIGPALDKVQKLKEFADSKGISLTNMAIRWVIDQPGVTCALVGANTPGQVEQNIKAVDMKLEQSDIESIKSIIG